jgi:hypothetical protein
VKRVAAFVGVWLFTALAAAAAAEAATPPTLGGESFHDGAPTITSLSCQPPALSGTFAAHGSATGPYPGTFQETGSVVGSPGPETLTASFTIDSSVGRVTGTVSSNVLGVACALDGTFFSFNTEAFLDSDKFLASDTYDATIFTTSRDDRLRDALGDRRASAEEHHRRHRRHHAGRAFADNGLFGVQFQQGTTPIPGFDEGFVSALASPQQLRSGRPHDASVHFRSR